MYLFEDEKNLEELEKTLKEWVGTPFKHYCGVKKGGADCIHFVARVLEEFGKGPFKIPWYPADWHVHNTTELLLEGIISQLEFEPGDIDDPENGDIVLYKFGKVISHAAIYLNGFIYQSVLKDGVLELQWFDPVWYKRRKMVLRVTE
jgi:cell wall-associated NlpC family hydrolase